MFNVIFRFSHCYIIIHYLKESNQHGNYCPNTTKSETIEVLQLLMATNGDSAGWLNLLAKHQEDYHTIMESDIGL